MRPAQRGEEEPGNRAQPGDDAARAAGRGGAGRFEGSRDDRPLLGYDTPTGLTCPYTTPLDVTGRRRRALGVAVAPLAGAHGCFRICGNAPAGAAHRSPASRGCAHAGAVHIATAARCRHIRGGGRPAGPQSGPARPPRPYGRRSSGAPVRMTHQRGLSRPGQEGANWCCCQRNQAHRQNRQTQ